MKKLLCYYIVFISTLSSGFGITSNDSNSIKTNDLVRINTFLSPFNKIMLGSPQKPFLIQSSTMQYPFHQYDIELQGQEKNMDMFHPFLNEFTIGMSLNNKNHLGLEHTYSQASCFQYFSYALFYAHTIRLSHSEFTLAGSLSLNHSKVDYSKSTWYDQIDPRLGFIHPTGEVLPDNSQQPVYLNYKLGLLYHIKNFNIGYTLKKYTTPVYSSSENNNLKTYDEHRFQLQYRYCMTYWNLYPAISTIYDHENNIEIRPGINTLILEKYLAGIGARYTQFKLNTFVFNIGAQLTKRITLNLSSSMATEEYLKEFGRISEISGTLLFKLN